MSVSSVSQANASYWQEVFGAIGSQKSQQSGGNLASMLFQDLDTDGSGGISLEESGLSEEQYKSLDANQDGLTTLEELQNALELQRKALNARIQMEKFQIEFSDGLEQSGETDDSGKSSAQDLLSAILNGEPLGPPPGGPGGPGMPQENDDLASKLFGDLDSDSDGGVSLAESGLDQSTFDAMDTNQDGVVSAEELSAALEKQRAMMGSNQAVSGSTNGASGLFDAESASGSKAKNFLSALASNAYLANMAAQQKIGGSQGFNLTA